MAKQTINVGTRPNDHTGDLNRTAFVKINENFDELYDSIDAHYDVDTSTNPPEITNVLGWNGQRWVPAIAAGAQGIQGIQGTQGPPGNFTVEDNCGIIYDSQTDILDTQYNTTIADNVMSVELGSVPSMLASTWKTKNIVEVLDTILFPTVEASITTPKSVVLSCSPTSTYIEIGDSVERTLTATFNRGRITNGDGSQGPELVGNATLYTFTGTDVAVPVEQANNILTITVTALEGNNIWFVDVTHDGDITPYYTNKGVIGTNLDGSRVAGTESDATPAIVGIYPYFWGISDTTLTPSEIKAIIESNTANAVILPASGTITINFNASGKFLWFAHDASKTTKTKWYVTALNQGSIGTISDLFNAPDTASINSPIGRWSNKQYLVYVSNYATDSVFPMEFRNS